MPSWPDCSVKLNSETSKARGSTNKNKPQLTGGCFCYIFGNQIMCLKIFVLFRVLFEKAKLKVALKIRKASNNAVLSHFHYTEHMNE